MSVPQIDRRVLIGVANRDLKAGELVREGDVIVQGYAQIRVEAPPALVEQWRRQSRAARWRARREAVRLWLIHLLGGIDHSEQDDPE